VILLIDRPSEVHPETYRRVFWNTDRTTWTALLSDGSSFSTTWTLGGQGPAAEEEAEAWKR
jgi:hypothetical protein